ncbi:MAG: MbnH family di-heme enzyme [Myxococcota bacterium]|nr:MbnH family di-heme enzyme [Myxococcota bacterium]
MGNQTERNTNATSGFILRWLLMVCSFPAMVSCGDSGIDASETPFTLQIPEHFPTAPVPEDNLPTAAKLELGRFLFYDPLLSFNESYSCATCHQQALAFTDGRPVAVGASDQSHSVGSMSLANVGYAATLGWGNPTLTSLEAQALVPMFNEDPVELGLSALTEQDLLDRLQAEDRYQRLFPAAFPADDEPFTVGNIAKAIATFERTIISANSPYDRYMKGDRSALDASAIRGMNLFFSERLECFHCHGGFAMSDSVKSPDFPFTERPFHNNGMYNLGGSGQYPSNQGVYELTRERQDLGRFKAPTLRNIAVTAPYLHDGSISTLDELIDLYAAGGRQISDGPHAGDGTAHPNKSVFIVGFILNDNEKQDLMAFLNSLTDEEFLKNPELSDPYKDTTD